MSELSVCDLHGKSISLLGLGVSNRAVLEFLISHGIYPVVRSRERVDLPSGCLGVFTPDYMEACEDVVFRSPGVRLDFPENARVYTEISYALERAQGIKIGITGSDGKSTTTTLIYEILKEAGLVAHLVGNIGTPLISRLDSIKKDDFIACELSSFQLFDYTPTLNTAVVTSISENHLDWHKSLAEYILSKRNIVKNAERVVLNHDMDCAWLFAAPKTVYFSLRDMTKSIGYGDFAYVSDGWACYNGVRVFELDKMKIKGGHNVKNALAAMAAVYPYASPNAIRSAVYNFSGLENRAEVVCVKNGIHFINSSADTTPSRTKSTLSAFDCGKSLVIMGGHDKCLDYSILSEVTKELSAVIIFGANREKIYNATKKSAKRVIVVNDIFEATRVAYSEAAMGDYIILSPASASFDMFKDYKDRAEKFKDAIRGL